MIPSSPYSFNTERRVIMATSVSHFFASQYSQPLPWIALTKPVHCSLCGEPLQKLAYALPGTASTSDFTNYYGINEQQHFYGCHDCAAFLRLFTTSKKDSAEADIETEADTEAATEIDSDSDSNAETDSHSPFSLHQGWYRYVAHEPAEIFTFKDFSQNPDAWQILHQAIFTKQPQVWAALTKSPKINLTTYLNLTPAHSRYLNILTTANIGAPYVARVLRQELWDSLTLVATTIDKIASHQGKRPSTPTQYPKTVSSLTAGAFKKGNRLTSISSAVIAGNYDIQRLIKVLLPTIPLISLDEAFTAFSLHPA